MLTSKCIDEYGLSASRKAQGREGQASRENSRFFRERSTEVAPCQFSASPWTALRAWCWSGLQPLLLPVAGGGPHSDHKLKHGRVQFTSARSCSGCASRKW